MKVKNKAQAKETKRMSQAGLIWKRYKKNKLAILGLAMLITIIVLCLIGMALIPYENVITQDLKNRFMEPCLEHPFGTDMFGRDLFARIAYGGLTSLSCGLATVLVALILGVLFGSTAGYFGGKIDTIIMRFIDAAMCIPGLLLCMSLVIALGQGTGTLILAMAVSSFPGLARIIRSSVMTLRTSEYVDAAKCYGAPWYQILLKQVLPNGIGPVVVSATLTLGSAILAISGLGFLGMGVPSPEPEWGTILSEVREHIRYYPYLGIFPGMAIGLSVLSINFIGDGLRDALDPRTKK